MRNFNVTLGATAALLASLMLLAGCDQGPRRVAGGGSDIGNGSAVAGVVVSADGLPQIAVTARLRPAGYLTPLPAGAPKRAAADTAAEVLSDSSGRFLFKSIRPGSYRIEFFRTAAGGRALTECRVDSGGKAVELDKVRLAEPAALILRAPAGAASGSKAYVRFPGLERPPVVVEAGVPVRVEGLPAAEFILDFASTDAAFAARSGTRVALLPGEAADPDSIAAPCGDYACDSLALADFLKANAVDAPVSRFATGSGRITGLTFSGLPFGYHFATLGSLGRLTAVTTFRSEGPYWTDTLMEPLMQSLDRMDSLWLLSLSWSKDSAFTKIPASIGKLTNLRELYLLGDSLRAVPGEIENLTKLEFISVQFNRLTELPDWGGLTALRELQVPHNLLRTLPESLFSWPAIAKLDIADNHLCGLTQVQKDFLASRDAPWDAATQTCP